MTWLRSRIPCQQPSQHLNSNLHITQLMIPSIWTCWKWEKVLSIIRWFLLHFCSQICVWKYEFIWPSCQVANGQQLDYSESSFSFERYSHARAYRESEILPFTFRRVPLSPTPCTKIPELCASCWPCLHSLVAVSPAAYPLPFLAACSRETFTSWLPYLFTSFVPALAQALRGKGIERAKSRGIQWIIKSPVRILGARYLRTTCSLPMQIDVALWIQQKTPECHSFYRCKIENEKRFSK